MTTGSLTRLAVPSIASVVLAMLARDLKVAMRELVSLLVRTALQPILFVVVFGYLLPKMGFVAGNYSAALLPGVLAVSLALTAVQAVALPLVTDFGFTKEVEDRLLAPVPTGAVALEKIIAGVIQAIASVLVVLPIARLVMGPIPELSFSHLGLIVIVTILGAAAFSALGMVLGTAVAPQHIAVMFSVIIAPMIFFGCAYYPWKGLDAVPVLKYAVLVNPLVYVGEGLRGAMTPSVPHMPLAFSTSALVMLTVLFGWLGARNFERRAVG